MLYLSCLPVEIFLIQEISLSETQKPLFDNRNETQICKYSPILPLLKNNH